MKRIAEKVAAASSDHPDGTAKSTIIEGIDAPLQDKEVYKKYCAGGEKSGRSRKRITTLEKNTWLRHKQTLIDLSRHELNWNIVDGVKVLQVPLSSSSTYEYVKRHFRGRSKDDLMKMSTYEDIQEYNFHLLTSLGIQITNEDRKKSVDNIIDNF